MEGEIVFEFGESYRITGQLSMILGTIEGFFNRRRYFLTALVREDGIYITGYAKYKYQSEVEKAREITLGRIVAGSVIGKSTTETYLQIKEAKYKHLSYGESIPKKFEPDLVKMLRKYIS